MPAVEAEPYTRPKSKPVYDRLRAHILEGHFPPGQWLKQADLEAKYNATRNDVRAALSALTEKGMVEYVKNQGFRVFARSADEIRDIVQIITVLETAAAPGMVAHVTPARLKELTALARRFDAQIGKASHSDLRMINYQFHSRLNALSGNARMAGIVQNLRENCISGPFGRYTTYEGLQASSREHFEILDALNARDAARLAGLLQSHASHTA